MNTNTTKMRLVEYITGNVPNVTPTQASAVVETICAVGDAIRELGSVPSGHLYAHLCGSMSLEAYLRIIAILKALDMVHESGHLLTWIPEDVVATPDAPMAPPGWTHVDTSVQS